MSAITARRLLRLALLCTAMTAAAPALADPATGPAKDPQRDNDILVQAQRIAQDEHAGTGRFST